MIGIGLAVLGIIGLLILLRIAFFGIWIGVAGVGEGLDRFIQQKTREQIGSICNIAGIFCTFATIAQGCPSMVAGEVIHPSWRLMLAAVVLLLAGVAI